MPFDPSKYPSNWKDISHQIRFIRADGQCEWTEDGRRCEARHLEAHPLTGSKVVLTTAHLNHTPMDCRFENLMAMCQLHHLRYDSKLHTATRRGKQN